jgi:hypothetical protein
MNKNLIKDCQYVTVHYRRIVLTHGMGNARHEIPPSKLVAGPTPMFLNMGPAAMGKPQAKSERRMVLADVALAAYIPYSSTK